MQVPLKFIYNSIFGHVFISIGVSVIGFSPLSKKVSRISPYLPICSHHIGIILYDESVFFLTSMTIHDVVSLWNFCNIIHFLQSTFSDVECNKVNILSKSFPLRCPCLPSNHQRSPTPVPFFSHCCYLYPKEKPHCFQGFNLIPLPTCRDLYDF